MHADPDHSAATPTDAEDAARPHLALTVGGQLFLLDVAHIREILDVPAISPLPGGGSDILGLIDLRGQAIEVADLATRLGIGHDPCGGEGRILVLDTGRARPSGVRVDRVERVVEIAMSRIEAVPDSCRGDRVSGVTRLDSRLALVLDPVAVLGSPAALSL